MTVYVISDHIFLCRSRSVDWRIVILEKIPISGEMSGKHCPQVFLKNFLIFKRVYISFDWRHSFQPPPPCHGLILILFSLFLNEVRSPTFVSFSPDPKSVIMTHHYFGFIGNNHTLSVVYSPNSSSPTPSGPFLTIDIFNNKFLFNNTPPVIMFM